MPDPNDSPNANPNPDPGPGSARNPASDTGSRGGSPPKPRGSHIFQAPTGTRDLYPEDVARRRYLTNAWRDVSIRHGFEEIEGPTFEHLDLYTVKSGEGIVSELFSFRRTGGEKDYALRPEFTPTLARMYAARAGSLQRPTKWFTAGPYFRAERPQRGRLREFLQWNVDIMGLPGDVAADSDEAAVLKAEMDADCIGCLVGLIQHLGFDPDAVKACINDRQLTEGVLYKSFVKAKFESGLEQAFALLDKRAKISPDEFARQAEQIGLIAPAFDDLTRKTINSLNLAKLGSPGVIAYYGDKTADEEQAMFDATPTAGLARLFRDPQMMAISKWTDISPDVVRGLAYYTGTVFEVIADGERAVAGGGRYDNLIELFGGPPTPAVGFGMGDVVLSLLLQNHNLMPEGPELLDAISRPPASVRPEVFVINAGNREDAHKYEPLITPLLAGLRRGIESEAWKSRNDRKPWHPDRYATGDSKNGLTGVRPLHARKSYKSTQNLKKLLADANRQHARFAALIHEPNEVELRDLDRVFGDQGRLVPKDVPGMPADEAFFHISPDSPVYVGGAVAALLP